MNIIGDKAVSGVEQSVLFVPFSDVDEGVQLIRSLRVAVPSLKRLPCIALEDLDALTGLITDPDGEYVVLLPWTTDDPLWPAILTTWDKVRYSARELLDDGHLHVLHQSGINLLA